MDNFRPTLPVISGQLLPMDLMHIWRRPISVKVQVIQINYEFGCRVVNRLIWRSIFKAVTGNWQWQNVFWHFHWLHHVLSIFVSLQIQNLISVALEASKAMNSITSQEVVVNYPIKILSLLKCPVFSPNNLQLKVGSVIKMWQNINQLCICNDHNFLKRNWWITSLK